MRIGEVYSVESWKFESEGMGRVVGIGERDVRESVEERGAVYTTASSSPSGHIANMEPKSVTKPRWRSRGGLFLKLVVLRWLEQAPKALIQSVAYEHNNFRELASRSSLDMMAATFCEENSNPATFSVAVVIFSLHEPGNISRALSGENIGTLIDQTGRSG
ncbi:hypothetical protein R6Q59_011480 [Mikania micrantha]